MNLSAKLATTTVVSALLVAPLSQAAQTTSSGYYDDATVTKVQPMTRSMQIVEPSQCCLQEYRWVPVRYDGYHRNSSLPGVFGAIAGAAVGSQLGHGRGRGWTTAAGALLGWSIGHDMAYINHGYENVYIDEFRYDYIDEPMYGYIDEFRYDYIDEPMDDYIDEPMYDYIYELEEGYM